MMKILAIQFVIVLCLLHSVAYSAPLPEGTSCAEDEKDVNSVKVTSVTELANGLDVKVSWQPGTGSTPEFAIVYVTTSSAPSLDYASTLGRVDMHDSRVSVSKFDNAGNAKISIRNLDPTLSYFVYANGYRCRMQKNIGKTHFVAKWVSSNVNGEKNIYVARLNARCTEIKPSIDRVDLTRSAIKKETFGTLIHFRYMDCSNSGGSQIPFSAVSVVDDGDGSSVGVDYSLTYMPSQIDMLQDVIESQNNGSNKWWSYRHSNNQRRWIESYISVSRSVGNVSIHFIGAGEGGNQFYYSLPKEGSEWIDDASRLVAGMLTTPQSSGAPLTEPGSDQNGDVAKIAAAISILMRGSTASAGNDVSNFAIGLWNDIKDLPIMDPHDQIQVNRIERYFSSGSANLTTRLIAGILPEIKPVLMNTDANATPSGWVRIGVNPFQEQLENVKTTIMLTENIGLYVRSSTGEFFPLEPKGSLSVNGEKKYVVDLSMTPAATVSETYSALLKQKGLWVRALSSANGVSPKEPLQDQLEPYLIEVCTGTLACVAYRGGVDRRSAIDEQVKNAEGGIRRGNVAEMLPGQTRKYKLRSSLAFPSSQTITKIISSNCSSDFSSCNLSTTIPANSLRDFSITATPEATAGVGRFALELADQSSTVNNPTNAFVLDMNARIFGTTHLIIVGNETNNDGTIYGYQKAADIFSKYLYSNGVSTVNVRIVDCFAKTKDGAAFSCTSPELNKIVGSYSNPGQNKLSQVTWFGHGSQQGYPIIKNRSDWMPEKTPRSFESGSVFTSFACHGGVEPGISAFASAWGTNIIGNEYYTDVVALQNINKKWYTVDKASKDANDIVFVSDPVKDLAHPPKFTCPSGVRRAVSPAKPYKFILGVPNVDPTTGAVSLIKSPYALEDYPLFQIGNPLNYPAF